jgi:hypothetical protein
VATSSDHSSAHADEAEREPMGSRRRGLGSVLDYCGEFLGWPIVLIQLRAEFRRNRFLWVHSICLALQAAALLTAIGSRIEDPSVPPSQIGEAAFDRFFLVQLVVVVFVFPAFSAAAFAEERGRNTLDLVLVSALTPGEIVRGKLLASTFYGFFQVFATAPLLAITLLFGGVGVESVLVATAVLIALTVVLSSFGVLVSSMSRSTPRATFVVYSCILGIVGSFWLFAGDSTDTPGTTFAGTTFAAFADKRISLAAAGAIQLILAAVDIIAIVALFLILAERFIRRGRADSSAASRILVLVYVPLRVFLSLARQRQQWIDEQVLLTAEVADTACVDLALWLLAILVVVIIVLSTEEIDFTGRRRRAAFPGRATRRPHTLLSLLEPGPGRGTAFGVLVSVLSCALLLVVRKWFLIDDSPGTPSAAAAGLAPRLARALEIVPLHVAWIGGLGLFLAALGFRPIQARIVLLSIVLTTWLLPWIFVVSDETNSLDPCQPLSPLVLWSSLDHLEAPPSYGRVTYRLGAWHVSELARLVYGGGSLVFIAVASWIVRSRRKRALATSNADVAPARTDPISSRDDRDSGRLRR